MELLARNRRGRICTRNREGRNLVPYLFGHTPRPQIRLRVSESDSRVSCVTTRFRLATLLTPSPSTPKLRVTVGADFVEVSETLFNLHLYVLRCAASLVASNTPSLSSHTTVRARYYINLTYVPLRRSRYILVLHRLDRGTLGPSLHHILHTYAVNRIRTCKPYFRTDAFKAPGVSHFSSPCHGSFSR